MGKATDMAPGDGLQARALTLVALDGAGVTLLLRPR